MATITSGVSAVQAVLTAQTGWWLKDPLAPSLNQALFVEEAEFSEAEQQAQFSPLGRAGVVTVRGTLQGERINLTVMMQDKTQYDGLEGMRRNQRPLLLQSDDGLNMYVTWGDERSWSYASKGTKRFRRLPIQFIQTDKP